MSDAPISFEERLARARKEAESKGATISSAAPKPPATPTPPRVTFMESKPNTEIQAIVDGLDIIRAYNKYANKGTVPPTSRTEGIKVRCPNPAHPDNNPSAWINTDNQTWYCASCVQGGDKYDIAAWYFGMPVPGYKDGRNFHELRERIAASEGYVVTRAAGITTVSKPDPQPEPPVAPVADDKVELPDGTTIDVGAPKPPEELAVVTPLRPITLDEEIEVSLDWKPLCPPGTFLDTYMKQAVIDDVPEEYHLWNGLLALSVALGRDATLQDLRPVYGNLFVCILGRTGSGKSKAKYLLDQLLHQALPYSATDPFSKGVLRTPAPASAEALIWTFQKRIEDPSAPKGTPPELYPVRGIIDYSELSSLVARAQRTGSSLVPTLMQFYDMESTVSTVSRTHGSEVALEPYACAITTSQPKSLKGLLTVGDAASGFLNRWFFAMGKEKRRIPVGGVMPDITPAIRPLKEVHAWASAAKGVAWSQDALDLFEKMFYTKIEPMMKQDETDLLSRLDLLCKKLILLFTANMQHVEVQVEAIRQVEHMLPYLLECYGVPGAQVGNTLQEEIRKEILRAIVSHTKRKKSAPSSRDINQLLKHKKFPLDLYNKTLKHMVELDEIAETTVVSGDKGGRPTKRYTVDSIDDAAAMVRVLSGGKEA